MTATLAKPRARERLSRHRNHISLPDPHTANAVTVTDRASVAGTIERLLTIEEAGNFLRLSQSWLAKARMRGDGPPFVQFGRSIRYAESALLQWTKSHQRLSTTDPGNGARDVRWPLPPAGEPSE